MESKRGGGDREDSEPAEKGSPLRKFVIPSACEESLSNSNSLQYERYSQRSNDKLKKTDKSEELSLEFLVPLSGLFQETFKLWFLAEAVHQRVGREIGIAKESTLHRMMQHV